MSPTTTATTPARRRIPARRLLDAIAGPHGIDGYLEQINPTLAIDECRAEVVTISHGTEDSVTLTLRPNRAWKGLRAGQFVQVSVEIDGVRHTRCYSPASPEGSGRELEITIKRHPDGLVSNFLAEHARPGMVIGLSQADGDFYLPDSRPDSILLIGAGSGITPLMAILRTLCAEGHAGQIALIQYAPDPDRAIYRQELDRLAAETPNFKLTRSYTRAPGAGELDGHFSPAHLPQAEPSFAAAETFACGPPALLDAVRGTWANGLEQRLHVESFVPPSLLPVGEPGTGSIRFADSNLEVQNTGASILEQAEKAGIPAQSGCRMGICHTCTCRKLSGTVKNLLTDEVSAADGEEIQLCVSAPLSDLVIDL
ncbi:MAG: ferredoxin reductase [Solirubrobacterales bacterium]